MVTLGDMQVLQTNLTKPTKHFLGGKTKRQYSPRRNRTKFYYDGLNRLFTQTTTGQSISQSFTYDAIGNIITKTGINGIYQYGQTGAGPHAVSSIDGNAYTYDGNGNNLTGPSRTINYYTFDKPSTILKDGHTTSFSYAPDRSRYRRTDNGADSTTTRYIGNVEIISRSDGSTERKRSVAGVAIEIAYSTTGTRELIYTLKDHLGSIDVLVDSAGAPIEQLSFGVWGQRRQAVDWQEIDASNQIIDLGPDFDVHDLATKTTRGFTSHEILDATDVVHMNGRIYDPFIGRFLQADPIVQGPGNTQSQNRYSYALNNPLNGTDPTGYLLGFLPHLIPAAMVSRADMEIGKPVHRQLAKNPSLATFVQIVGTAVSTAYCGPCSIGFNAQFSKNMTYAQNGSVSAAYTAAAAAGASSAITYGVNQLNMNGLRGAAVSALAGGISAELSGGKFANGAATATFSWAIQAGLKNWKSERGTLYKVTASAGELKEEIMPLHTTGIKALTVNGMNNELSTAMEYGFQQLGRPSGFYLYYNPTVNFSVDLLQSGFGKVFGSSKLAVELSGILARNAETLANVSSHSQGALIVANALEMLPDGALQASTKFRFFGPAASKSWTQRVVGNAGGDKFVVWDSNPFDFVGNIIGGGASGLDEWFGSIVAFPLLFTKWSPHGANSNYGQ